MSNTIPTDDTRRDSTRLREAVVHVSWAELETLGVGPLVSHCRAVGIRAIGLLEDDTPRYVLQLAVTSPLDKALLTDAPAVTHWDRLADSGDIVRYLIELTAPGLSDALIEASDRLVGTPGVAVDDQGVVLTLLGRQRTLGDVIRQLQRVGLTLDLRKLGDYSGDGSSLDALTARQIEAIKTAYRLGFYEVPRQTTTEAVADELGVDPATAAEHLQRAERNLLYSELPIS